MNRSKHFFVTLVSACLLPIAAFAGPVDVNSANAKTISAELKGVGMSKASAIVEFRETHGPFQSREDLMQVRGIGIRTIEINAENILVNPAGKKDKN